MIHLIEPHIWLSEHEAEGTDDSATITLIRDWDDSGDPAVFVSSLVRTALTLLEAAKNTVDWMEDHRTYMDESVRDGFDALVDGLQSIIARAEGDEHGN